MTRLFVLILLGAVVGIVLGYVIFAEVAGEYIPVKTLISVNADQNPDSLKEAFQALGNSISEILLDIESIRKNIAISGLVGAGIGVLLFAALRPKRKS